MLSEAVRAASLIGDVLCIPGLNAVLCDAVLLSSLISVPASHPDTVAQPLCVGPQERRAVQGEHRLDCGVISLLYVNC